MSRWGNKFPLDGVVYRSKYERIQAQRLIDNNINFEYEHHPLGYSDKIGNGRCEACGSTDVTKARVYTPDFWFPKSNIYVETKGLLDADSKRIMTSVVKDHPKLDIRMVFMRDNYITKKHSMRYSRWCELRDIEYAIGNIPLSWLEKDRRE